MTNETKPELLPCPFCGGAAEMEDAFFDCNHYWVECTVCKNGTWTHEDKPAEAIAAWNRRAPTDQARIAELEALLKKQTVKAETSMACQLIHIAKIEQLQKTLYDMGYVENWEEDGEDD